MKSLEVKIHFKNLIFVVLTVLASHTTAIEHNCQNWNKRLINKHPWYSIGLQTLDNTFSKITFLLSSFLRGKYYTTNQED